MQSEEEILKIKSLFFMVLAKNMVMKWHPLSSGLYNQYLIINKIPGYILIQGDKIASVELSVYLNFFKILKYNFNTLLFQSTNFY